MADTIHVNPEELSNQISKLNELCESNKTIDKINEASSQFSISSGETAEVVAEINSELKTLNARIKTLFQETLDFLNNANAHYIEADENVAKSVEKASAEFIIK